MKAIVWTRYGPPEVLQLREVETPVPQENEVRIKVHATTVTAGDCELRDLSLPVLYALPLRLYAGLTRPKRMPILGQELSGEIEAVGQKVRRLKVGEPVFAATGFGLGGYAEYICLPEESEDGVVAPKPTNMSFKEAAAVPFGGLEALHFLRKGNIREGEAILVNGAGGSIGTFGIQLAKYFGAEVTAVDRGDKLEMLRAIGADRVIDYTQSDFTETGDTYDVIFDVIGKSPFARSLRTLNPGGRLLLANPKLADFVRGPWVSGRSSKRVIAGTAVRTVEDLLFLKRLIEAGDLKTVIDRTYPLEEMAEAHRYVATGAKKGNLIITMAADP